MEKSDRENQLRPQFGLVEVFKMAPQFEGKENEDPKFFIRRLRDFAEMGNLTSKQMVVLLIAKVKGEAEEWLKNSQRLWEEDNFEVVANDLIEWFDNEPSTWGRYRVLTRIKQVVGMSVKEFAFKVENAARKLLQLPENPAADVQRMLDRLILAHFVHQLLPVIKKEVNMREFDTFAEAFEIAQRIETAIKDEENRERDDMQYIQYENHDVNNVQHIQCTITTEIGESETSEGVQFSQNYNGEVNQDLETRCVAEVKTAEKAGKRWRTANRPFPYGRVNNKKKLENSEKNYGGTKCQEKQQHRKFAHKRQNIESHEEQHEDIGRDRFPQGEYHIRPPDVTITKFVKGRNRGRLKE